MNFARGRNGLVVLAFVFATSSDHARANDKASSERSPRTQEDEREVPDYDGRGDDPSTAGDVLLWVPRVIAAPFYLVSEYVVRIPLGALVTTAEKHEWPTALVNFFTFNEEHTAGIVPTALIGFDFRPSVGLFFFWDDALATHNDIRVHAATWGPDWLSLTAIDRIRSPDETLSYTFRGHISRRPDYLFSGIGPRFDADSRYSADLIEGSFLFEAELWRASFVSWEAGFRKTRFRSQGCCDDPAIQQRVDAGSFELPPGFAEGTQAYRQAARAAIDTRQPRPAPITGVRLEVFGEHALDVEDPVGRRWVKYGAAFGGTVDPFANARTLSLWVHGELADPIAGEVPFTALASLGGEPPFEGFYEGSLLGRSAVAASLEYRWPVWIWLDMSAHVAVGNVFGQHFEGFDPELGRLSFGLGFKTLGEPDHAISFVLGMGTETFRDGTSVTSLRLEVGANRGF